MKTLIEQISRIVEAHDGEWHSIVFVYNGETLRAVIS